jgi:D-3-phosphoglycerate dehydrogenase / 2-oxoglutarate reductase
MKNNIAVITPIKHLNNVFEEISKYGNITYKPEIKKSELKDLLINNNINIIFTNPNKQHFMLNEEVLDGTSIKLINTCSTGTNHIDKEYCKKKNIEIWSLTKDMDLINDLPSTSELAFGLMLSLVRNINMGFNSVKNGNWDYEPYIGRQLKELTLGIIGFGRLGKIMADFSIGFGIKILVYDPYVKKYENGTKVLGNMNRYYECVSKEYLCKNSDVVSLHVHVTDETRYMVNNDFLKNMKDKSYLVNTSRGELVNEEDIINNLKSGKLYGYGTDVIFDEFNGENSKLVELSKTNKYNIVITPHVGGMTWEGQQKAFLYATRKFKKLQKE